jgi:hypothetical protein
MTFGVYQKNFAKEIIESLLGRAALFTGIIRICQLRQTKNFVQFLQETSGATHIELCQQHPKKFGFCHLSVHCFDQTDRRIRVVRYDAIDEINQS